MATISLNTELYGPGPLESHDDFGSHGNQAGCGSPGSQHGSQGGLNQIWMYGSLPRAILTPLVVCVYLLFGLQPLSFDKVAWIIIKSQILSNPH